MIVKSAIPFRLVRFWDVKFNVKQDENPQRRQKEISLERLGEANASVRRDESPQRASQRQAKAQSAWNQ